MQVSRAIALLEKLNPDDVIYITWFDKTEFMYEFSEWAETTELPVVNDDEWETVVDGTEGDDRIADAIMESMRFDFKRISEIQIETQVEQLDKELWEK
jgi:hypothetical protein